MTTINILTIGFTRKTAQDFFTLLRDARVARVIDVRLNNQSQLAGFTKKQDLAYFLKEILGMEYVHLPILAPTRAMLRAYRLRKMPWADYQQQFLDLMAHRQIEQHLDRAIMLDGCLLCSEHEPHHCHRRLVTEYLQANWGNVTIEHLTNTATRIRRDDGSFKPAL